MTSTSRRTRLIVAIVLAGYFWPTHSRAQPDWTPVNESTESSQTIPNPNQRWEAVPQEQTSKADLTWELLSAEQADSEPEDLDWSETNTSRSFSSTEQKNSRTDKEPEAADGRLRWPNGQLMNEEDQKYFRTAYSRGSMIQIGELYIPILDLTLFNASLIHLQALNLSE